MRVQFTKDYGVYRAGDFVVMPRDEANRLREQGRVETSQKVVTVGIHNKMVGGEALKRKRGRPRKEVLSGSA